MNQNIIVRRDTASWGAQVWISFLLSVALCVGGIWQLPSQSLDRAFIAIGYFFCLSAAFGVAKMVRDNQNEAVDTPAWRLQVWIAFAVAVALTAWGLFRMTIGDWEKAFLACSWLFLMSSSFTLAKAMRDKHEADLLEAVRFGPGETGKE